MKKLVILTHPNMSQSVVNKRWKEELEKDPNITVHELYDSYPDGEIDVKAEQALVDAHDSIVFQFPIYWYNCPPLMKQWMDEVLTPGWAYMGHYALSGKHLAFAVTTGGTASDYSKTSRGGATIEEVLTPFRLSTGYLKAEYHPAFVCYDSFNVEDEELDKNAAEYLKFVQKL